MPHLRSQVDVPAAGVDAVDVFVLRAGRGEREVYCCEPSTAAQTNAVIVCRAAIRTNTPQAYAYLAVESLDSCDLQLPRILLF